MLRKQIFKANLQKINDHNKLYNQGQSTYTVGITNFTDYVCYIIVFKILKYQKILKIIFYIDY